MLNKELCIKCYNSTNDEWNAMDEELWDEKGRVYCPVEYREKEEEKAYYKTKGKPPSKCPYLIEQILINQEIK